MKFVSAFLVLTFLLLFSCKNNTSDTKKTSGGNPDIIAMIDSVAISTKALKYRKETEKAYGNQNINDASALILLINDAMERAVAKRYKINATRQDIAKLDRHSTKTSKAPELLQQIRDIYGNDTLAYQKLYLSPNIYNYKLHSFFHRNHEIHREAKQKIEISWNALASNNNLNDVANTTHAKYSIDTLFKELLEGEKGAGPGPPLNVKESFLLETLEKLNEGDINPNIVEEDKYFRILKLLSKTNDFYVIETLSVPKKEFDPWFFEECQQLNIQIFDERLKNQLKQTYPGLWWVGKLK